MSPYRQFVLCAVLLAAILPVDPVLAHEHGGAEDEQEYAGNYPITDLIESGDDGVIVNRRSVAWRIELGRDGRYRLTMAHTDTGVWRLLKGAGPKGNDTIRLDSDSGESCGVRIEGRELRILLGRNEAGNAIWLFTGPPQEAEAAQNDSVEAGIDRLIESMAPVKGIPPIRGRHFAAVEIYATSSAPVYWRLDPATGAISFDGLGVLFTPAGQFHINSRYGVVESHFTGTYEITKDGVLLSLSDGSSMVLTFADEGGTLKWYDDGILIARYQRVIARQ